MFHNGKIYAQYIETEGLEVEHVIAIPKEYTKNGVKRVIDTDYRKNELFDIHLPITQDNYPVVKDEEDVHQIVDGQYVIVTEADRDVPFVVISGYTGKLTSRGADISGTLTVGDKISNTSKYIAISDNKDEDSAIEYGKSPGMYIM
jgi:hypothetical protein